MVSSYDIRRQSIYFRTHPYTCSQTWDIFGHDVDMQDEAFTTINPIAGLVSHLTSALSALNTKPQDLQTLLPLEYCTCSTVEVSKYRNRRKITNMAFAHSAHSFNPPELAVGFS